MALLAQPYAERGHFRPRVLLGIGGALALVLVCLEGPVNAQSEVSQAGYVDADRAAAANAEPDNWLMHGRTWSEQRHSPLTAIHRGNVSSLGLAWSYATGSRRGLEATPLVIDGVFYATSTWSEVFALDAASGEQLWRFDPKVPRAKGRDACCDVVNRGVAAWKGRIYLGTIDGRLIALDAQTGRPVWERLTVDAARPYTITGAPRVVKDLVIIGNGGAEFGVRGYFSAYDAATGELRWRFYTVPASKSGPHEHPELELAAETWSADSLFESGLGGTVWDAMAYDPELDLLYVGVGNSSVYNRRFRSPGGGDNLYLASILAVRPDTGRLEWHYQTTPGEHWDYTATQHIILADLRIGAVQRKVLMQAPKNGFFYVLDRESGELLSADPYVHVSWASHVDLESGRPVERPEAVWEERSAIVSPAVVGGHNWHPMSFHPGTGLVYVPSIETFYLYSPDQGFRFQPGRFNTGEDLPELARTAEDFEELPRHSCGPTRLLAWDPVARRKVWEVRHTATVPGGVLSSAGGLVFQGTGTVLAAYDAATGQRLFQADVGVGIMAPPISYQVGGEQYVAVLAGIGGSQGAHFTTLESMNEGRVLAFKLGASAPLPAKRPRPDVRVEAPRQGASPQTVSRGRDLYAIHCMRCHGTGAKSSGLIPDLRFSSGAVHERWNDIVLGGIRAAGGMASFADVLRPEDAAAIQAYVVERAYHEPGALESAASWLSERACIPTSWVTD